MTRDERRKLADAIKSMPHIELPDALRIPLHELQADNKGAFARASTEGFEVAQMLADSVANKLSQVETACYAQSARASELEAEVERFKRLLKPFAAHSQTMASSAWKEGFGLGVFHEPSYDGDGRYLSVADFRAAAEAVKE